ELQRPAAVEPVLERGAPARPTLAARGRPRQWREVRAGRRLAPALALVHGALLGLLPRRERALGVDGGEQRHVLPHVHPAPGGRRAGRPRRPRARSPAAAARTARDRRGRAGSPPAGRAAAAAARRPLRRRARRRRGRSRRPVRTAPRASHRARTEYVRRLTLP